MIMIVTPDKKFRREIFIYLQEREYRLSVPEHRQDVLRLVQEQQPLLIILDLSIADPNGPTVLKQIRKAGYAGKIILISGASKQTLIADVHQSKIDQVVSKSPTDPIGLLLDQLECTIRQLFRDPVSKRAYAYYLQRSCTHGNDWEDWFKAEKEILKTPLVGSSST